MTDGSPISQVRVGMDVVTSDGDSLGRVTQVYSGTEPSDPLEQCEDESCMEVHRQLLGREFVDYIPCRAIADVSEDAVRLKVGTDAAGIQGWGSRPGWLDRQ